MPPKRSLKRRGRKGRPVRIVPQREARRFPRVEVEWAVTVEMPDHRPQKGKLVGLNPFGAKLRLRSGRSAPPEGTTLQLRLTLPDDEPPLTIRGLVWRRDRDGQALVFVNLAVGDFARLKKLVAGSAPQPS